MKKLLLSLMVMFGSFSSIAFATEIETLPLGFSELSKSLSVDNYVQANLPVMNIKTPEGYPKADVVSQTPAVPAQPFVAYNKTFNFTGSSQTWSAPYTGTYKLEVWGASGGDIPIGYNNGAKGGYAYGTINLNAGSTLYIYVGEQPTSATNTSGTNPGGWNGGGMGFIYNQCNRESGGGGATDVRQGGTSLTNRVIVAGGGGGSSTNTCSDGSWCPYDNTSGVGGGLVGGNGVNGATGGTQTVGGVKSAGSPANGSLGQGGQATTGAFAGGGGGYYGGSADVTGGAGGSSYIGGVQNGGTTAGLQKGHGKAVITRVQ